VTFGAHAAFGSIAQPDKLPLRLTVRDGVSWLVETDGAKVAGIVNAATRPQRPDFFIPPSSHRGSATGTGPAMASAPATAAAGTATANTVDLVIGYTQGFAAANGGNSGAVTRLNYLVDVANAAYVNSGISATARLVATVPVTYTDTNTNDDALAKLTGYDANSNSSIPTDPAFNALRAARDQYGADLVSLVRTFNTPENGGCGIAWLIGGGQSGVAQSDSDFGYSVVSDGRDTGTDGKSYFCLDETLAHELGHNMGAAHDLKTSEGDDGVLQADEYGAYPYSFGYKTAAGTGNFYTIMAYGDTGQTIYRIFSDPRSTFCGGRACGTTTQADNARTLTQTIPIIATFRASLVGSVGGVAASDFDNDGRSDVFWRNTSNGGNTIWKSANRNTSQGVVGVTSQSWKVVGVGDFDGDGRADALWRNFSSGGNTIWKSGNRDTQQAVVGVPLSWQVVGVGDFDGDGKSDILWRNFSSGGNTIWKSGNRNTQQTVVSVPLSWHVVGIGDFDGDGKSDILWRNFSSGGNTIWKSGNRDTQQSVVGVTSQSWKVVGVGDFDADGRSDIVWRNFSTGGNTIWKSGNRNTSLAMVGVSSQSWHVVQVGDFDGDGKSDVLWRNFSTGSNTIWKTANRNTEQAVAGVYLAWTVVP